MSEEISMDKLEEAKEIQREYFKQERQKIAAERAEIKKLSLSLKERNVAMKAKEANFLKSIGEKPPKTKPYKRKDKKKEVEE